MKKYFSALCAIFFCLVLLPSVGAMDFTMMGEDEDWLPPPGEEYLAFNFAGFLTAETREDLLDDQADLPNFFDEERLSFDYRTQLFQMFIDGSLLDDGTYSEQEPYLGGRYFYLNDAYLKTNLDRFQLKVGQGPHHDVVDTPYSLFISSNDFSVLHAEIDYDGDFFFYKTRWVSMNNDSSQIYYGSDDDWSTIWTSMGVNSSDLEEPSGETYWLDKGMNFKVYGFNLGEGWRVGFEDVVVYLGRSFDANYFFNPIPQYFLQLITTEDGNPWVQAGNTKSMMGFFVDVTRDDWGAETQLLIDDINLSFLPFVPDRSFKDKIAWNIGGWKDFSFGTMGFHHAGATKYTFESTRTIESDDSWGDVGYVDVPYSILPYEYTYYPVNEYTLKNGEQMAIPYEDLYAGYKYGENNLAFLVDYENLMFAGTSQEFKLYASFEYVMNGSKSPSNPWHEYDSPRNSDIEDSAWCMFTGAPIEYVFRAKANARKPIGDFTVLMEVQAGYVINGAELIEVDANYEDYDTIYWTEPKIYVPQNGNNFPIFGVTVGFNYSWRLK